MVCSIATFALENLGSSAVVNWSSSNTSLLTINSSSGIATKVGNGQVTITVVVNNNCGSTSLSKTVWTGVPTGTITSIVNMFGPGITQVCRSGTASLNVGATIPANQGISQVAWNLGSWSSYNTGYSPSSGLTNRIANFTFSGGSVPSPVSLSAALQNSCGVGSYFSQSFIAISCGSFTLTYPNPVSEVMTLSFNQSYEKLPEQISFINEQSQKVVFSIGHEEIEASLTKEMTLPIVVNKFERGVYYLHIQKSGKYLEKIRVFLE